MLDIVAQPAFWASLVLLIGMEIVLSADNVVFISSMAAKLPEEHRRKVLRIAMALAAVFRLLLLFGVVWVLSLERTAISIAGWSPSWRELILLAGGLFLVYKAVTELHALVEPVLADRPDGFDVSDSLTLGVLQIVLINAVFSVDSILTAIGLTPYIEAMAIAVVVSVAFLYVAASTIGDVIARHPSVKALALGFLLVVGVMLVADGLGLEVVRPYLYAAMVFAIIVLAISKLVRRLSGKETLAPAVVVAHHEPEFERSVVAPEPFIDSELWARRNSEIEPVMEVPDTTVEEPVSLDVVAPEADSQEEAEPLEPVIEDDPIGPPERPALAVVEEEQGTSDLTDPLATDDNIGQTATDERDEETVGDLDRAVPKSRPKRTIQQRRHLRPRTGRRRE